MPSNIFFPRSRAARLFGGDDRLAVQRLRAEQHLRPVLLTEDRTRGWGTVNRHGYSNPRVDEIYERAVVTMDQRTARAAVAGGDAHRDGRMRRCCRCITR